MSKIRLQQKKKVAERRAAKRKAVVPKGKYPCPCCGELTLETVGNYEICPRCGWEDDPSQSKDLDFEGGANELSLNQACAKWRQGR